MDDLDSWRNYLKDDSLNYFFVVKHIGIVVCQRLKYALKENWSAANYT